MKKALSLSKKIWLRLSYLGSNEKMSLSEQKRVLLMNQLTIILFIIIESMQIISDIYYLQITFASHFSIFLILTTLYSNYKGAYLSSGVLLSILTPFFMTLFSVISKATPENIVPLHTYVFPRLILLSSITLPIILIEKKHKIAFYSSILFVLSCIFLLPVLEDLYKVGILDVNLELKSFRMLNIFTIFPLAIILFGMMFLNNINEKYEEKILTFIKQLEQTNDNINDSITYASRIQSAVLPNLNVLEPYENFILYLPRHIVSGDFYWIKKKNEKIIIVAADCTGHGVPGAFVSMLGISILNEIFAKFENQTSAEILEDLRTNVKKSLNQNNQNTSTKDGMDLALCIIDTQTGIIQFSGANNPLLLARNQEIITYKPVKNPIGIYPKEKPFVSENITSQKNDVIYIFSDGYIDQFGGEKGDKYKMQRFKDFLISISSKPMEEQKVLLENEFKKWKNNREQIDDVLIMGIKL